MQCVRLVGSIPFLVDLELADTNLLEMGEMRNDPGLVKVLRHVLTLTFPVNYALEFPAIGSICPNVRKITLVSVPLRDVFKEVDVVQTISKLQALEWICFSINSAINFIADEAQFITFLAALKARLPRLTHVEVRCVFRSTPQYIYDSVSVA